MYYIASANVWWKKTLPNSPSETFGDKILVNACLFAFFVVHIINSFSY